MKKITLLFFIPLFLCSCDSKKQSIIDGQKLINKQLTGLADSLKHVSDTIAYNRIKNNILYLQFRFDSLNTELKKFD